MIIDAKAVLVDGKAYLVKVVADRDTSPSDYGADTFTQADIDAWRDGHWRYVGLIVESADDADKNTSLWSVCFGRMGEVTVTIDDLIAEDYYVPAMIREVNA